MSPRMVSTGVAASCCLSLGAFIAALILDSGHPLLQAVCVFASCLLVLGAVAAVEGICAIEDDAAVSEATPPSTSWDPRTIGWKVRR